MLDKCEVGTRYIHWKKPESAILPNAFSVASARRESRESRPGGKTSTQKGTNQAIFFILRLDQQTRNVKCPFIIYKRKPCFGIINLPSYLRYDRASQTHTEHYQ